MIELYVRSFEKPLINGKRIKSEEGLTDLIHALLIFSAGKNSRLIITIV